MFSIERYKFSKPSIIRGGLPDHKGFCAISGLSLNGLPLIIERLLNFLKQKIIFIAKLTVKFPDGEDNLLFSDIFNNIFILGIKTSDILI
jgi:hypothetical protein